MQGARLRLRKVSGEPGIEVVALLLLRVCRRLLLEDLGEFREEADKVLAMLRYKAVASRRVRSVIG